MPTSPPLIALRAVAPDIADRVEAAHAGCHRRDRDPSHATPDDIAADILATLTRPQRRIPAELWPSGAPPRSWRTAPPLAA